MILLIQKNKNQFNTIFKNKEYRFKKTTSKNRKVLLLDRPKKVKSFIEYLNENKYTPKGVYFHFIYYGATGYITELSGTVIRKYNINQKKYREILLERYFTELFEKYFHKEIRDFNQEIIIEDKDLDLDIRFDESKKYISNEVLYDILSYEISEKKFNKKLHSRSSKGFRT